MKTAVALILSVFVVACASFEPQNGMSYPEFQKMAAASGNGGTEIVGMKGNVSVYRLTGMTDHDIFYWFENGRLTKIERGELPQIRYQIELLKR